MAKLKEASLNDVCLLVTDGTHDTPKRVKAGFPLIKAKEIVGGKIDFETCDQISEEEHLQVIARSKPEYGDTLFAHIGASLGEAAFVKTHRPFSIKNIALFKPDPKIINERYLYYLVISPDFQGLAKQAKTGSAQPFLSLEHLRSHRITYNEAQNEQRKIAAILSAYDDLIENNLRRIKVLEDMAQLIYREWFVNFRFPGHEKVRIMDSETGRVPEGWRVGKINELATIKSGYVFKSGDFVKGGRYGLVTIKNVHDGRFIPDCQSHIQEIPANTPEYCRLQTGDILLSLTGNIGRICLVYGDDLLLNQRVAKLVPAKAAFCGYVYFFFRQRELQKRLEALATGVAQQNLSPVQTSEMEVLLPSNDLIGLFADYSEAIVKGILVLYRQTATLRRTLDLLLPKLISGELDVEGSDIDTEGGDEDL